MPPLPWRVRVVLGMPIKKVRIRTEAALLVNQDYQGVRLDVYADDYEESVYDVEIQTTHKRNLPKRSRLYLGQMDMAFLEPGADFNELPKSFVIFICTYDPFGYGRYRYTYNTRRRETGKELVDETYKIFLNTKGKNAEEEPLELVRFLKYVEDASQAAEQMNDSLIQRIETRIADIKQNREMEVRYMLFSEMLRYERKEGREEGWKEGWEKGQEKTRESLFKLMDLMEAGGDEDKISLIRKSPDLLEAMCKKYHIET